MKKYLGQFYSKNLKKDIEKFKETIKKNSDKIFLEPFVGEGDLLFMYLSIMEDLGFSSKKLFEEDKIRCYDISSTNIKNLKEKLSELGFTNLDKSIIVNDSLKCNKLSGKEAFIITNPPYLYKVAAKKLNYDMSYFNEHIDLYEVAIDLYKEFNGIWIVPSNIFFSSHIHILTKIIKNIDNIYLFKESKFSDTNISITIFELNKEIDNKELKINNKIYKIKDDRLYFSEIKKTTKTIKYKFGFYKKDFSTKGKEFTLDTKEKIKSNLNIDNSIIIKMFDSTNSEDIGFYDVSDLIKEDIMFNKVSSRMFFQVFFDDDIDKDIIKNDFNKNFIELRKKYDSSFLTNFLSTSSKDAFNRKRLSISQAKHLINQIIIKNYPEKTK